MVRVREIKKAGTARTQRYQVSLLPPESGHVGYVKGFFFILRNHLSFKLGWGVGKGVMLCVY